MQKKYNPWPLRWDGWNSSWRVDSLAEKFCVQIQNARQNLEITIGPVFVAVARSGSHPYVFISVVPSSVQSQCGNVFIFRDFVLRDRKWTRLNRRFFLF